MLGIAAYATISGAQDKPEPAKIDIEYLGVPAESAFRSFADSARLKLDVADDLDLEGPVWLSAKKLEVWQATRLLSVAADLSVTTEDGRLMVRPTDSRGGHNTTRGYDVSVLTGRFVEYVNKYGENGAPVANVKKRTASEHLALFVEGVAGNCWRDSLMVSAVGDRLLVSASGATQLRVREFLDLLMAENGGESPDLKRERNQLNALRARKGAYSVEEKPFGSIVAELCREAKADFALDAELASLTSDLHVTYSGNGTFEEIIAEIAREHVGPIRVTGHRGVALITMADGDTVGSERVFDAADLLKRIDAAFQRQKTQPGKRQGFEEGLREAGGMDVVGEAVNGHLKQQGFDPVVSSYATRLVVGGGPDAVDAALAILKEMGWEEPAASPTDH
jgi:hypothetical protein